MATITKRGNTYRIKVSLGYVDNKQVIKSTTFKPTETNPKKIEREVNAFAQQFEEQCLNGSLPNDNKITFEQFVEIWRKNWLPAKTPTVRENYYDVLRVRVLPHIGKLKLVAVRTTHIDNIIRQEKEEGKAPQTVRMTFVVINSVFTYALKKQYVRENPCSRCDDLPPAQMKTGNDICFWNVNQTKTFLNDALTMEYAHNVKGHKRVLKSTGEEYKVPDYVEKKSIALQWQVYFNVAIFGGLRRGEECALTWEDIDFSSGVVRINKALAAVKGAQIVKSPKTDSGIRDIIIPDFCMALLGDLKKEQTEKALKMGTAWKGHRNSKTDNFDKNYIFTQEDGSAINLSSPGHKFGEIIALYNATRGKEEEKLPIIRLHDLRHTNATLLLSQNTDIETVSRRLGHSKTSVTLDIYGHALPENDKKASDVLSRMFGA